MKTENFNKQEQLQQIEEELKLELLQGGLRNIIKAGQAIQAIGHCRSEKDVLDKLKDRDFSNLDLIYVGQLEDAIDLLAEFVQNEGNDLCKHFGLQLGY